MWYAGAQPRAITAITLTPCSQSNNRRCHRCNNKLESNPALRATLNAATLGVANAISYNIRKIYVDDFFSKTRSYAALRAADLDWIIGPGYSSGGYILEKNHEKPTWNLEKPWKPTKNHEKP